MNDANDIDREKRLDEIRGICLACRACAIGGVDFDGHGSNVFSMGMANSSLMIVGQNPGRDEVLQRQPFVGVSGKLFDEALKENVGLARADVYVTNVVKCYTIGNRAPYGDELEACREFLDKEIEIVKPKVVLALGSYAFKQLTGMSGIMKHCGEVVHSVKYNVPVVACLHPSPYNTNDPEKKEMFLAALRKLREVLDGAAA
jgi:DNA polymerase